MDNTDFKVTTNRVITYGQLRIKVSAESAKHFQDAVASATRPFWYSFSGIELLMGCGVPVTVEFDIEGADVTVKSYDLSKGGEPLSSVVIDKP